MSWVDKIYKNHFGKQKFPKEMKQSGWESMQNLLDAEMPVSTPKGSAAGSGPWYWIGAAAVVATVVGLPFFIMNQPKEVNQSSEPIYMPATSIEYRVVEKAAEQDENISTKEVTPQDIANANIHEQQVENNPVAQESLTGNNSTTSLSNDNIKPSDEAKVETAVAVSDSKGHEQNASLQEDILSDSKVEAETVVAAELPATEIQKTEAEVERQDEGLSVEVVSEVMVADQQVEVLKDDVVTSVEEYESQNVESLPTREMVESSDQGTEVVNNETEVQEEDFNGESVATNETIVAVDQVDEKDEDAVAEVNQDEEGDELNSILEEEGEDVSKLMNSTVKAAHLAFLDADEEAPIPDLLTFSKERFALSVWGGYLYTGKVLSGDESQHIDQLKSAEKYGFSTPTGVGLDYFVDGNWTVGTGIGWAEYGEEVDYTLYNVTSSFDSLSIDGRFDSPSNYPNIVSIDSIRVIDTVNQGHWDYNLVYRIDDSTANQYKGRNIYRYIEVPLTVGYRFGGDRVKPWIKAGVIVGLPVEATYAYPQFNTAEFMQVSGKDKLASIQYSGLLQLGVDFYLTRALSLQVNALGTYQINPMLTYDGISQRYYRVGGSVGLAYNF